MQPCDFCLVPPHDGRPFYYRDEHPALMCCEMCYALASASYDFQKIEQDEIRVVRDKMCVATISSETPLLPVPVMGTHVINAPHQATLAEILCRMAVPCSFRGYLIDNMFSTILNVSENWNTANWKEHKKNFRLIEDLVFLKIGIPGKMTGFSFGDNIWLDEDEVVVSIQFILTEGKKLRSSVVKKIRGPLRITTFGKCFKETDKPVFVSSKREERIEAMQKNAKSAMQAYCC